MCPADPCEAASMPLRGALVRGTARLLRPSAFHYSPAVGLVASASSHLAANLLHAERLVHGPLCCGYGPALELSRELLHEPAEGDVRLAASRSRAASYITPALAGHILGLSLAQASTSDINSALRAAGVQTNRVGGEWTGISLARWRRLVELVTSGVEQSASTPAVPLLLRCVWERAERKQCLLDFVLALDSHVPVLAPAYARIRDDAAMRGAWLQDEFEASELSHAAVDEAALLILEDLAAGEGEGCSASTGDSEGTAAVTPSVTASTSADELATAFELLALSVSQATAPRLHMRGQRRCICTLGPLVTLTLPAPLAFPARRAPFVSLCRSAAIPTAEDLPSQIASSSAYGSSLGCCCGVRNRTPSTSPGCRNPPSRSSRLSSAIRCSPLLLPMAPRVGSSFARASVAVITSPARRMDRCTSWHRD